MNYVEDVYVVVSSGNITNIIDCVRNGDSRLVIVDLSADQVYSASSLHSEFSSLSAGERRDVSWIDGKNLVSEVGDASREEYIRWLSRISDKAIFGRSSIKEWFTYGGEVSMWWFTKMSEKHPVHHPYRQLFFQIHAVQHLAKQERFAEAYWHIWAKRTAVARVLEASCPADNHVRLHVTNKDNLPSGSAKTIVREYLEHSKAGRLLLALKRGARRLLTDASRLYREVRRTSYGETVPQRNGLSQMESGEEPFVLCQTRYPKSWKRATSFDHLDESGGAYDRYFGDAPWRLQDRGLDIAWLPSMSSSNVQRWRHFTGHKPRADASSAMRFRPG